MLGVSVPQPISNNGDFVITGMAFTTMGGKGNYDRIELLRNDPRELN